MQIGMSGTALVARASVDSIRAHAASAANDGFSSYSIAEHPTGGFDALTVLALVGRDFPDMRFASAVIPTMPRHPLVLAGQARTVANALDGRFTLGVGLSHAVMMAALGIGFDKPIRHLREYLSILMPLLDTGSVDYQGETLSCKAQLFASPAPVACPVVVAALGPQALKVAGTFTDGTTLAWVGPNTIRDHIAPRIQDAAEAAGRKAPRIIASLPVCVTDDASSVRESIDATSAMYGDLPSYRAMFDREGARGPGDVAIVGSEDAVLESIDNLRQAGASEFIASEYGSADDRARTRALLTTLL